MKALMVLLAIFFVYVPAPAQEQTIFGDTEIEHGGYGGPVVKFASVNDEIGVLVGGRGGWIINHTFSIGLAGYGLANNIKAHTVGPNGRKYLEMGYGGLDLEYIAESDNLLHFSIHSLIGGGSAGFRYSWDYQRRDYDYDDDYYNSNHDSFFIIEPGVNLDLNVTPWFRTSAGVSYRYVTGLSSAATTNSDISGLSAGLTFRFGKF
jgi:hypothetical protein